MLSKINQELEWYAAELKALADQITDLNGADDPTVAFLNIALKDESWGGVPLARAAIGAARVRLDIPPCEGCRRATFVEFDIRAWAEKRSAEIAEDVSKMITEATQKVRSEMLLEDWQRSTGLH